MYRGERHLWKGLAAGLAGGLAASWTMNRFQGLWSALARTRERARAAAQAGGRGDAAPQPKQQGGQDENATVKTASAISQRLFHHPLTEGEKEAAGPVVHYTFGTSMGGLYGIATEVMPAAGSGAGMPFGAAVWLAADEIAVPALSLSKPASEAPLSSHVYALASHLVYGLTADAVRRLVRRMI